jgi:hypothetical protein
MQGEILGRGARGEGRKHRIANPNVFFASVRSSGAHAQNCRAVELAIERGKAVPLLIPNLSGVRSSALARGAEGLPKSIKGHSNDLLEEVPKREIGDRNNRFCLRLEHC